MKGRSALLLALGAVFFGFGILSVLLWIAGAPSDPAWIGGNLVVGLGLLAAALAAGFESIRDRMRSGEGRRIGRYGSSALAQTLIVLAIVGALGFLANRYHKKWDASEAKVHSISDQTQKVLSGLEQDVQVVAFYPKLDQENARVLLDKYKYVSDRMKVEYADPNTRPDLIERYGVSPEKIGEGLLFVKIGEESVQIDKADEEKLTNAIVKLTRRSHKKAYFVTGHNERVVEGKGADGKEGFAHAAEALRNENYRFEPLNLETKPDVPDDADVVIIAGPTQPLRPGDADKLERYAERGGALMVLVDPRANTDIGTLLAQWGVQLGNDVIVDRVQGLFGQAMTPLAGEYTNHEITRDMREVTIFPTTRSLAIEPNAAKQIVAIVKTGENSWGERDLDQLFGKGVAELGPDDVKGPVTIGVAGEPVTPASVAAAGNDKDPKKDAKKARLVVFGDSDFATNGMLDAYSNKDLFVNSVNWLLGDVEAIAVRPAKSRASRLTLSNEQFSQIRVLSLFVLPELIAVAGVWAWWSRRRAPGR